MKMELNKRRQGISLIVLVITIIVMIILAAAIILTLDGNNIVTKANEAKHSSDMANTTEAASIVFAEYDLKTKLGKIDGTQISADKYVKDTLKSQGHPADMLEKIYITSKGKIQIIPKIPTGFTRSIYIDEQDLDDGMVIYKTDAATLATKDKETAQKEYDQFVWIPVDDMSKFTRTVWKNNMPTGSIDTFVEPYAVQIDEYEEMKLSVAKYGGFYVARYEAGDGNAQEERTTYTTGANTVVSRKGAFIYNYVGWGKNYKDTQSDIITSDGTVNKGKGAVYLSQNMYASEINKNYTTNLICGVQWDYIMRWLSDKYNVTDSKTWGNNADSTGAAAKGSGVLRTCGYNEAWQAKNIYDMAGNVSEWTMETLPTAYRVTRGGRYSMNSTRISAATRYNSFYANETYGYVGFRPVLYLK